MKRIFIATALLWCLCAVCKAQQVSYISSDESNVTFRCVGYGKKEELAQNNAELAAMAVVLYQGVEGKSNLQPLIQGSQSAVEQEHYSYFYAFYNGGGYAKFIVSETVAQPFGKDANKQKCIVLDITVNRRALRAELQNNGVIKKLGFY